MDEFDFKLSEALDALSAIRNAIVHRGGFADDEYRACAATQKFAMLPELAADGAIMLDGDKAKDILDKMVLTAMKLIMAVDQWIAHQRSEHEKEDSGKAKAKAKTKTRK